MRVGSLALSYALRTFSKGNSWLHEGGARFFWLTFDFRPEGFLSSREAYLLFCKDRRYPGNSRLVL